MLDISLESVRFARRAPPFVLEADLRFPAHSHTALAGTAGSGKSTLLRLIEGSLRPDAGTIRFGTRDATRLGPWKRPVLFISAAAEFPARWSLQHILLAALHAGKLDREERLEELDHVAEKWELKVSLRREYRDLSSTEQARARFARLEVLRPGLVVADRPFSGVNPPDLPFLIDRFYRILRIFGATAVVEVGAPQEMGACERVVVLDRGRVIQEGSPREIHAEPVSRAAAEAVGPANFLPVMVSGGRVSSGIGEWETEARFSGPGTAVLRPDIFSVALPGEESDMILGIEEAHFREGQWEISGILTGGGLLRVLLPGALAVHKGKLLPLRYDARRIAIFPGGEPLPERIPTDVVPPRDGGR